MSVPNMDDLLASATEAQLKQMLAQAETYLNAQLNIGTAADQRALVFAGFIAAATVAVAGGASALLLGATHLFLGYLSLSTAIGLLISLGCAVYAARPVDFEYAGNSPAEWAADVAEKKSIARSMREQASHYAGMIDTNNATLAGNCRWLRRSQWTAFGVLCVAGASLVAFFGIRDIGSAICP